ncbi:Asp-tRNA(Asn)/Glu-tRNA(Gln) amidotransferase subunit GatC [Sellimonas sp.]|uniref:Asp-tRNA(Asn)/Glu-tRNA(Gln) amidotransferase subunit GatC n=1 Tax=Sellimonas sp. TaxID=2021466 RepID=UPI00257ADC55|nr:Asp-tRNA(Asn)/Glu-tRNA(Gln) amidotransferase subunit GatC [Sellimonas sp.]
MKKISWDDTMEYLEILSQISLTEEEKQETAGELKKILAYMEKLEELDTDGVEPMSHVFPVQNVFREDIVEREDQWEALLENAPQKKEGQYLVPKTV